MTSFNLDEVLSNYPCSKHLKAGFKYYIELNDIKINNQKDFNKIIKQYFNLKVGE